MKRYRVTITLTVDSTASEKDVEHSISNMLPVGMVSNMTLSGKVIINTINKRVSVFQTNSTHEQIQPN